MPIKLALLRNLSMDDYPSMRVVAEELHAAINAEPSLGMKASQVFPTFRKTILGSLAGKVRPPLRAHVDRLVNMFALYPMRLKRQLQSYDAFLICDQAYSHLVHHMPASRVGIYCHDIDTFYHGIDPGFEARASWISRRLARRVAEGFKQAALIFYSTEFVRAEILRFDLAPPEKLVKAFFGTHPDFRLPSGATCLPSELDGVSYLLHVGSCWQRKRIDVLLDVFAGVKQVLPDMKLVKVGGIWSDEQKAQMARLGIESSIIHYPWIERPRLASLYGQAALVLMPSDSEGFGLPIIEALACGAVILASDMEVFREVGGGAAVYCQIADVNAWIDAACTIMLGTKVAPLLDVRLQQASKYTWSGFAQIVADAYRRIL